MEMIKHCNRNHPLSLKPAEGPYICFGCKQLGSGTCYQCSIKKCDSYIHEECAHAPTRASHPFFKDCEFIFYKKAPTKRGLVCDACGQDVLGFSYQCTHKHSFDLHPCCLTLKREIESDGVRMTLVNKVDSKCLYCKKKKIDSEVKGWSYISSCKKYCYHVACVKKIVIENLKKKNYSGASTSTTDTRSSLSLPSHGTMTRTNVNNWSGSKYLKIARTLLKLIISAIFGDPIGLMVALVESFNS